MFKPVKKSISILLCALLLISVASIAVSANDGLRVNTPIGDVITSTEGTNTFYFYMPDDWKNKYNDTHVEGDESSYSAGIYWFDGNKELMPENWPGYNVSEQVEPGIFVAHVPKDVTTIIWNNTVDGGADNTLEVYAASKQTNNIPSVCFEPNDPADCYKFYPDGLPSFDKMIYVCDPEYKDINNYGGRDLSRGSWFYYYGDGKYGLYETLAEAEDHNDVLSNGQFLQNNLKLDKDYVSIAVGDTDVITPNVANAVAEVADPSIATIEQNPDTGEITVNGIAEGKTTVKFTYKNELNTIRTRICDVKVYTPKPNEPIPSYIYFDSRKWKDVQQICCHVWERGKDSFFKWQSEEEYCVKKAYFWAYDLNKLGELKEDADYCLIFSDLSGKQTYDMTFGTSCIGDSVVITGNTTVGATDSDKMCYEADWTAHKDKYGTHLAISPSGVIIGSVLCPNESGIEVLGDWLPIYSKNTNFDVVFVVAKAMPKLGIKDTESVLDYIKANNPDTEKADLDLMQQQLEKAYAVAYPKESETTKTEITLKKTSETVYLTGTVKVSANVKNSKGTTTYKSSNSKIAKVSKTGVVTGLKAGKATITVTNNGVSKKITVTVKKPVLNKKTVTLQVKKSFTLKITGKVGKVTFTSSNKKIATVNSKGKIVAKKKGKATITVKTNGIKLACKITVK